jgi:hypothetical protein
MQQRAPDKLLTILRTGKGIFQSTLLLPSVGFAAGEHLALDSVLVY